MADIPGAIVNLRETAMNKNIESRSKNKEILNDVHFTRNRLIAVQSSIERALTTMTNAYNVNSTDNNIQNIEKSTRSLIKQLQSFSSISSDHYFAYINSNNVSNDNQDGYKINSNSNPELLLTTILPNSQQQEQDALYSNNFRNNNDSDINKSEFDYSYDWYNDKIDTALNAMDDVINQYEDSKT